MDINEPLNINPVTRVIDIPSEFILGVVGDEYINRVYFKCPKVVGDGLDLTTAHVYINYVNAKKEENNYLCDDVAVIEDDYVIFSWLLYPQVCAVKGSVTFNVCVMKTALEDASDDTHWNTTTAKSKVLKGLEVIENIVESNPNVIDQIVTRLDEAENDIQSFPTKLSEFENDLDMDYAKENHTHTDLATKEDLKNVSVSEEQIENVVENYLEENPIEGGGIDISYDEENKAVVFTGSSGESDSSGGSEALYPLPLVAELTLTEEVSKIEFKVDQFPLMKGLNSILYIEGEINPSEDIKTNNTQWRISVLSESKSRYAFTSNKVLSSTKTTYYQCTIERVAENRTNAMTVSKEIKYGVHDKIGVGINCIMFDNWHGLRDNPINFEHIVLVPDPSSALFGVGTTIRIYGR